MASSIVDEARRAAVLVHDDGHVGAPAAHLAEEVLGPLELGDEERRVDVLRTARSVCSSASDRSKRSLAWRMPTMLSIEPR